MADPGLPPPPPPPRALIPRQQSLLLEAAEPVCESSRRSISTSSLRHPSWRAHLTPHTQVEGEGICLPIDRLDSASGHRRTNERTQHDESRAINPFQTPLESETSLTQTQVQHLTQPIPVAVHYHNSQHKQPEVAIKTIDVVPRYDAEVETINAGKALVAREKKYIILALLLVNGFCIFATWWWPRFWFVFLPFITFTVALNTIMIFSIGLFKLLHLCFPEKKIIPETKEDIVYIIPCYNETREELTRSLDSLVDQKGTEEHRQAVIIIVDGRVMGPGMDKTCAETWFEDILVNNDYRKTIPNAYITWTREFMEVEVQAGRYRGMPYYCIAKQSNQGKRDTLMCVRSFLYHYNIRTAQTPGIFSQDFFSDLTRFLCQDAQINNVDVLIGMDADTVFDESCVAELMTESRYPETVGVCGYVSVDFTRSGHWNLWNLYQSTEYTISQGLRRLHQSTVTKKVSCLPGCCQLLKVCEATCGNYILYDLFGYCPKPTDNLLKHIRATASEDRNHVCLMLSAYSKSQTRQALKAQAYTDVPHSWNVFLSQRRRWTLGATANDLFLVTAPGVQWFERILAFTNCLTWCINIFVFACIACLIAAALHVKWWVILSISAVMLVPICYYICIVLWIPIGVRQRIQYLAGLVLYLFGGPFLNLFVLIYAVWNMDSFGWGKTRKVIEAKAATGKSTEVIQDEEDPQQEYEENITVTFNDPDEITRA